MIEIVEHTGELELHVRHATRAGLYVEALRGLAGEVSDARRGATVRREVALRAGGPDTLLAELLNEAIFLMDTEYFVATDLEITRLSDSALDGALVGHVDPELRPLAKAATYHGLRVTQVPGGWDGRVVLDV